jgi:Septum formation
MSGAARRYIILAAILIVIVGGIFVFRDRLSGNAGDLAVGDCFDAPTLDGGTVSDVQHHPCTEAHTGEVFAVITNPAGSDAAYPDQPARIAFAGDQCAAPFLTYVGIAMDSSALDIRYFGPTSDGWGKGDRTFTCYVNTDPAVTTSIKGSKQ